MDARRLSTSAFLAPLLLLIPLMLSQVACTSLFFQPTQTRYPYLELDRLSAETVRLKSKDGTEISAWKISSVLARKNHPEIERPKDLGPNEVRGITLQFHGNAENMTSHYKYQLWLLFQGWDVLTFDYRGYGSSNGSPKNLAGVRDDGVAAIDWAVATARETRKPLVIFGQSLGASLLLNSLGQYQSEIDKKRLEPIRMLVIDSSFYSFTSIATEKLSDIWFLWPFQWLGWLLVSDELSAARALKTPGPFYIPALFLHSENDPVVSNRQGLKLFEIYPGEKTRWTTKEIGHVNTLSAKDADSEGTYLEKLKLRLQKESRRQFKDGIEQAPK